MGRYKHVPEQMKLSASRLTDLIDEYNNKLREIETLINNIYNSPAWKDSVLKNAYNNTCNGYMKIHNNRSLNFSYNVMKLKEKARCAEEHERAYTTQGGV